MITFEGILIGTGVLWALNAILVAPLTNYLVKQKLNTPAYAHIGGNMEVAAELPEFNSLVNRCYMLTDTLVLGVAGFLFGAIFGWYFIGISFEARGWPGMISFIFTSVLGASIKV